MSVGGQLDIGVCVLSPSRLCKYRSGRHTDLDIGVCVLSPSRLCKYRSGRHTDLEDVRTTADQQGGIQILKMCVPRRISRAAYRS